MTTKASLLASAPLCHHSKLPPDSCHSTHPHHFSPLSSQPTHEQKHDLVLVLIPTLQAGDNLQHPFLAYTRGCVEDLRLIFPETQLHVNCSLSFAGVPISVMVTHEMLANLVVFVVQLAANLL